MKNIEENDLVPLEVDLGLSRRGELEEGPLRIFGNVVKIILNRMFGGSSQPVRVRGTKREINSFTQTLGREKRYMDSYIRNGGRSNKILTHDLALEKHTF